MKQRLISAAVAIAICIYPLLFGGISLKILLLFIGCVGSYEFIKCIKKEVDYRLLIVMIIAFLLLFLDADRFLLTAIFGELIVLFIFAIYDENITINDVFSISIMTFIFGICISYVFKMYENGFGKLFFYILLASLLCDSGAYFVGRKFGKHKLNERVSPKKTIEGSLGGIIFGFIFSFIFAYFSNYMGLPLYFVIICSLFLPIISEIGDLAFSLIKRYYGIKDFGNIMPGHGGVLDRIDSVIFCLLFFIALSNLLL